MATGAPPVKPQSRAHHSLLPGSVAAQPALILSSSQLVDFSLVPRPDLRAEQIHNGRIPVTQLANDLATLGTGADLPLAGLLCEGADPLGRPLQDLRDLARRGLLDAVDHDKVLDLHGGEKPGLTHLGL